MGVRQLVEKRGHLNFPPGHGYGRRTMVGMM
jgi:hypothetical protein